MPFHAYDEGNLNWLAAFEAEPATYAMALRVWPQEVKAGTVDSLEAQRRLRKGYTDALAGFISKHGLAEPKTILDIGCSVRGAESPPGNATLPPLAWARLRAGFRATLRDTSLAPPPPTRGRSASPRARCPRPSRRRR